MSYEEFCDETKEESDESSKKRKWDEAFYLPVDEIDKDNCEQDWIIESEFKIGCYASIHNACKAANKLDCNYVMKISVLRSEKQRNIFDKDQTILKKLQGTNIVPKIYNAWTCMKNNEKFGYIVLDKWDGDCSKFLQFHKKKLTIPEYIIKKMKHLLTILSSHKIVHGDVKPNNFLYKMKNSKIKMCLTDFGSSIDFKSEQKITKDRQLGWHWSTIGCKTETEFYELYNLWNLELYFISYPIKNKTPPLCLITKEGTLTPFKGFKELDVKINDLSIRQQFNSKCVLKTFLLNK